jgi:hypothetical protein
MKGVKRVKFMSTNNERDSPSRMLRKIPSCSKSRSKKFVILAKRLFDSWDALSVHASQLSWTLSGCEPGIIVDLKNKKLCIRGAGVSIVPN